MDKNKTFQIKTKNGELVNLNVIMEFYSKNNGKKYIVYTDKTYDNNELNVYISYYQEVDGHMILKNIEDEEEWLMINNELRKMGIKI